VKPVAIWIWVSAMATLAGWTLSAVGQLNRPGYIIFGATAFMILFVCKRPLGLCGGRATTTREVRSRRNNEAGAGLSPPSQTVSLPLWLRGWKRFRRRFRRPLPLCFAILAALIFLGGALYAPSNHTALSYRTPRVLHWLAEGGWLWIDTPNYRMNDRACGIEWLSAPIFLFLRSDRLLFLLNFIPYLLLPGLFFSICRSLGTCGRVAWQWMWVFPAGYAFLLQAGSAGNDTFPTVYGLAAIGFAFRAWKNRQVLDVWLSALSAALLTGAKASNLPLLLPWAILIAPLFRVVRQNVIGTVAIAVLALLVSFLPTAILNIHYCHDWSGLRMENAGMDMKNPFVGIWGNILIFILDNFLPPFFPMAGWWNQHALEIWPRFIVAPMRANFESGFHILGELPTEDWVGIGFGVSLLVAVSVAAALFYRRRHQLVGCRPANDRLPALVVRLVLLAPWFSLLAYCMKSGMVTGARLISPYYPLLLPGLLVLPGQSMVVRRTWWKALVALAMLLAFPVLILTPGRPLWPAQTILASLHATHPNNGAIARAFEVYKVYSMRPDPLAQVRALLPPDVNVVGFMAAEDDIEVSLWRPFGSRVVKDLLVTDSPDKIRSRGIEYVVVGGFNLKLRHTTLEEWLRKSRAEAIASTTATVKVAEGEQPWYVVKLK
jgi:hypothetical protein